MKRLIILLLLIANITGLIAQHNAVTSALSKCMNYYSTHPSLSFDMYYKMYESHESSKLIHQIVGSMKTNNGNICIKMGDQTQLFTSTYAIVTDDATKTMVVQERGIEKTSKTPLGIDSLVGMFGETTIDKETDAIITIAFSKPKASFYTINKFTVDIDKQTGRVIKAVLFYAFDLNDFYEDYETTTIPRIEIIYDNYSEGNSYGEEVFSENNFFKLKSDKIELAKNYTGYRLVDLRSLNKKKNE